MKKIAMLLILILTLLWLAGCTRHSNPTFKESEIVKRFAPSTQQSFG